MRSSNSRWCSSSHNMKLRIDNDSLAEEFFSDCRLLGIVAPMKDYQLGWKLNQALGYDFRVNNEIEIQLTKKNRRYFFSIFEWCEPAGSLRHYLYNNQFDGEYSLPEFKHLDFIWLMKGDDLKNEEVQDLQHAIRNIMGVQLVTELTTTKIRNKGHLIF